MAVAVPIAIALPVKVGAGDTAILTAVTLPSGSHGVYVAAAPSANYLIETNPLFASRSAFISSDYFLNRLGVDYTTLPKRLGDGYFEQTLVLDQLFALTGRRTLSNSTAGMAQFQALMDAGVSVAQSLSLTPGIELSATQVAALTGDIVWLVERIVAGQKVLVPQVYLAHATSMRLTPDGALIAADDISLTANQIANGGRLSGTHTLQLAAADITNRGVMETTSDAGIVQLATSRDIVNEGGTLAGNTVELVAGRDIENRAYTFDASATAAKGLGSTGSNRITDTEVGPAGRIVAGNSATLVAWRDLAFRGGQLASGGNASLDAGNNLDLGAATKRTDVAMTAYGGSAQSSRTVQTGSSLAVGGNLALTAGNDLTVTGSAAQAGGSLTATTGENLTVQAAKDEDIASGQFSLGKGGSTYAFERETVKGSSLAAGQDIVLTAGLNRTADQGGDMIITASRIESTAGSASLAASGNVAIGTEQQNRNRQSHTWGSSSGFLSSRSSDSKEANSNSLAIGSIVRAGQDVSLFSGGDTALVGSALDAGRNLGIQTLGTLALLAGTSTLSRAIESDTSSATLSFALDQQRPLLSTLSAGEGMNLQVGGNLLAHVGTTNARGQLEADRMTAQGVVAGADRQQVSVSGSGADTSRVLGSLSAQGIRNGANDSTVTAKIGAGDTAVQALVQGGLLSLRSNPQLQSLLAQAVAGATAWRDASGKLQLSVAGQVRAESVFNQLRLSETYVEKPDQLDQLAAMAVAVALSVYLGPQMSALVGSGATAGSTFAAATATTVAGTGNLMLSGALTSMASNAASQLIATGRIDAGALFQAGISAGLTAGLNQSLGFNQMAGVKDIGDGLVKGSLTAESFGSALQGMTGRALVGSAVNSAIYGSDFGSGFTQGMTTDLAAIGANAIGAQWGAGQNPYLQTLAHAGLGAGIATLRGQDALAGAVGGAAESGLGNLVDVDSNAAGSRALYAGGAILLGGLVASAAGRDGLTAALAAQNAAVNNRLMTQVEKDRVRQLAQDTGLSESRLARAACYEVKCWAQYPEGSAAREKAYISIGEVVDLSKELAVIRSEKTASGLFNYTLTQQAVDDFKSGPLPTIGAAAKVVGGGLAAWTGGTICGTSGVGCAVGGPMIGFGASELTEGATTLYNQYQGTGSGGVNPMRDGFNKISPVWGDLAYDASFLLLSGASLTSSVPAKLGASDGINRANSMFGVTVPRWQNPIVNPLTNDVIMTNNAARLLLLYGIGAKVPSVASDIEQVRSGK